MNEIEEREFEEQKAALERIADAVAVNDGDTLSLITPDKTVIWTASGSWEGERDITLGDLRAVAGPILRKRMEIERQKLRS